ncbi:CDGSH iron-sulfur domain-containing protein 3 [Trichinella spiralis]|uniref:CDGSH iron-sulfur domain-containing protein 3 n=1 Tax=Trichinella spiralis TaxID=6334 RepID=A0ABR3KBG8_TRISP
MSKSVDFAFVVQFGRDSFALLTRYFRINAELSISITVVYSDASRVIITQLVRRKTGWGPNTYYKKGTTFVGVAPNPLKYYTIWQKKPEEPYGLQGSNHLLPEYGKVYSRLPVKVKFEKDKKYAWCSCGYSHSQPYCDGSHNRENTRLRPVRYISDKDEEVWLCNCKQTRNRPFSGNDILSKRLVE